MALTHPIGLSEPEPPPTGDPGRVTPMMEQYIEIKAANPDCLLFYRMGDFYEMFFDDAETASRALGIVLTKRGKHQGRDIPMCGVPVVRADEYLHRLIALGHRVAVCEQLEDPAEAKKRGSKSVVRRDVIRLVTPGRIKLTPIEGGTQVTYDYDAEIGGKIASIGGRLLDGAAKVVIRQFFSALVRHTGGKKRGFFARLFGRGA